MKILFRTYFHQKKNSEKSWPKIYYGQDPDPDPVKNRPDPQQKYLLIMIEFTNAIGN
jgi:hypothetical protein